MATESKDVELRVRARDYSGKTLQGVTDALKDLADAQEKQLKAAKNGESSAAALEASYGKIEKAVQALVKQGALTQTFEKQAEALALAKQRLDEARRAQSDYANSIAGVESRTKAQIDRTKQLATAVTSADKAQTTAQNRLDRTTASLSKYGIAVENVAGAQQQIVAAVNSGNAALDRQQVAIDSLADDVARKAAADQAAAEKSKKAAADQAAADKLMAEASKRAADFQQRMAQVLNQRQKAAAEAAAADKVMTDAMRASAQQAEAAARGYATLARSVKSVRGDELANQIRAIVDPAAVANSNITGLGTTLDGLVAKVNAIKGPVKDFRSTLQSLKDAQGGVGSIAASIDAYRRQIDVLRASRTEYVAARTAVKALTDQMRAGGGDAAELGKQLNAAQVQLRNAAAGMSTQISKTKELRGALRQAGVDTKALGDAEARLVAQATQATSAVNSLTAAFKKNGGAAEGAAKGGLKFFDSTRTSLSYTQRLRGELLGLVTAYVGIQGAVNLATGALGAYRDTQKVNAQLGALVGQDSALIRQEWEYLMATANRIGFEFEKTAGAYAKFGIAAKAAGLSQQEMRFVFEKFAESARIAGQSGDEFEGILKAIEQMMSKGTIQAEELRGQLGDRLPGAFTIAAKAAGVTTAEFSKMMEAGEVSADYVINIARELGNTYTGIGTAVNSLAAQEARFNNAAFEFKKALADNGFADAYTTFLIKLTELMKSPEGANLAKTLSQGFVLIIDVLKLLVDNIETVKLVLATLLGIGVFKWAMTAVSGVSALVGIIGTMAGAVRTAVVATTALASGAAAVGTAATGAAVGAGAFGIALRALGTAIPILGALTLAVQAAMYAYDKLKASKDDAETKTTFAGEKLRAPLQPGKSASAGGTTDPGTGGSPEARAALALQNELAKNQEKLDKSSKAAEETSAKDSLARRRKLINNEYQVIRDNATKKITDKAKLESALATIDKQNKQALLIDEREFQNQHQRSGEAAGNKRIKLQEQIKNELLRIQDELAKQEVKQDSNATFDERRKTAVDAISHSYDKLKKTIASLAPMDKAGAADATTKLNAYIGQLQALETVKVTQEEIKRLEKALSEEAKLGAALREQEAAKYEAGLVSQEEFLANTAAITARTDTAVTQAAENLQTFVDAAVKAKAGILSLTEQSDIRTTTATAKADAGNTDNKVAEQAAKVQSDVLDALIAKRTAAEALFKAQLDARLISEDEYAAKVNASAETYKASVATQVEGMLQILEAQKAKALLDQTMNQTDLLALDQKILKYQALGVAIGNAQQQQNLLSQYTTQFMQQGLDVALDAAANALTQMAAGQMSISEGFEAMGRAALQFFADFMMEIAKAIIKQLILNALAGSGNPAISGPAMAAGGRVAHRGAVIGRNNDAPSRKVDPSWFVGAPRFHEGGVPGLKSDEVPAILQTNEEVLARDDPRNVLNGGKTAGNSAGTRVVLVDDRAKVPEAMRSAEGETVIMQTLRRNVAGLKQMVQG